jgi:hypothetical protein
MKQQPWATLAVNVSKTLSRKLSWHLKPKGMQFKGWPTLNLRECGKKAKRTRGSYDRRGSGSDYEEQIGGNDSAASELGPVLPVTATLKDCENEPP